MLLPWVNVTSRAPSGAALTGSPTFLMLFVTPPDGLAHVTAVVTAVTLAVCFSRRPREPARADPLSPRAGRPRNPRTPD